MKASNKNISIVIGVILICTSFMVGWKLGYNKEFYPTHNIEYTYNNNLKIKSTIYNREWTDDTNKITICSKEDKKETLKQLRKEGRLLIKYSKARRKLIKESRANTIKRKSVPLLTQVSKNTT